MLNIWSTATELGRQFRQASLFTHNLHACPAAKSARTNPRPPKSSMPKNKMYFLHINMISTCLSTKRTNSESSAPLESLISTRDGPFRLPLPQPCPPAPTSPEEGLSGGLLEGSCGRPMLRTLPTCRDARPLACFKTRNAIFQTREHRMSNTPAFGTVLRYQGWTRASHKQQTSIP